MKTIPIEITDQDLRNGKPRAASWSPAALAISRRLWCDRTNVAILADTIMLFRGHKCEIVQAPAALQAFTRKYDAGETVEPFAFDLTLHTGIY